MSKEYFSSAGGHQFIQKGHTHVDEKRNAKE